MLKCLNVGNRYILHSAVWLASMILQACMMPVQSTCSQYETPYATDSFTSGGFESWDCREVGLAGAGAKPLGDSNAATALTGEHSCRLLHACRYLWGSNDAVCSMLRAKARAW